LLVTLKLTCTGTRPGVLVQAHLEKESMFMRQKRLSVVAGVFGVCAVALMGWVFGAATGPASGQTAKAASAKATTVNVTLGKPSELAITLSKSSALVPGTVIFKVTNKGKTIHDFKVCTAQVVGKGREEHL